MFEHCDKFHIPKRILLQLVDEQHVMDNLRPTIVLLLVQLDISVIFASEYLSIAGNHHGMCRKSVLIRSKNRQQQSSRIDIYIPNSPCRVLDTSKIKIVAMID